MRIAVLGTGMAKTANTGGTEVHLSSWLRLMGALGTAAFNVKVVR